MSDCSYSSEERKLLKNCCICPRRCHVDRFSGELGECKTGVNPKVASYNLHYGEEPPISGTQGSGTIFFSYCNLHCIYCQNYPISQMGIGEVVSLPRLVEMMLELQTRGAHNINFVTPTHVTVQVRRAIICAKEQGLNIPIIYNSSGYDSVEQLRLVDGLVDIYLVDMRYDNNQVARRYSDVEDYGEINKQALKEMYRQTGVLQLDKKGIAKKGMIIRHLILPGGLSGTDGIFRFISEELSPQTYISLMSQYFPAWKALEDDKINRRITVEEYQEAVELLDKYGLERGWMQSFVGLKGGIGV